MYFHFTIANSVYCSPKINVLNRKAWKTERGTFDGYAISIRDFNDPEPDPIYTNIAIFSDESVSIQFATYLDRHLDLNDSGWVDIVIKKAQHDCNLYTRPKNEILDAINNVV